MENGQLVFRRQPTGYQLQDGQLVYRGGDQSAYEVQNSPDGPILVYRNGAGPSVSVDPTPPAISSEADFTGTGLDAYLDQAEAESRTVPKPQIQQFLAQNAVQVDEVVLGDRPSIADPGVSLDGVDRQRLVAEAAHDELTAATAAIFAQDGERHFVTQNFAHYYAEAVVGLASNNAETLYEAGTTMRL